MVASERLLTFDRVSKSFGEVRALDGVSFGVAAGSVHALLGENGAGKSTLLKILSGAHRATAGSLSIGGRAQDFQSPAQAFSSGVSVIYQELHLVPQMSVAANLFLGHVPQRFGVVDRQKLSTDAAALLARVAPQIGPSSRVASLSIGGRQMVEIAKALSRGARILAFDEPTSSLSSREVERLFAVIRGLASRGHAILYVTHRLDEVFALCDSATVLRDGQLVRSFACFDGVTQDQLVRCMVGRDISDVFGWTPRAKGESALSIDGLLGPGLSAPVSLEVARGEIVGLFGLVGAGRTELLRLVYGAARRTQGSIRVHGELVDISSPRNAIRAGVLLCPEDRRKEGLVPVRSVLENINLSARRNHAHAGFVLDERWERANAAEQMAKLAIKAPSLDTWTRTLSGGNQQKVILGRWLSEDMKVLLLDEPTRGVDIGARSEIYSIVYELAKQGAGILLVSSDLSEVLGVSDRVLVMRQGRLAGELKREEATQEAVLALALPQTP